MHSERIKTTGSLCILLIIFLVTITIFFGLFNQPSLFEIYKEVLNRNLEKINFLLMSFIFFSVAIICGFFYFAIYVLFSFHDKNFNQSLAITIYLIFFLVLGGIIFIDHFWGVKSLELALLDDNNNFNKVGSIKCLQPDRKIFLINELVDCVVDSPQLTYQKTELEFTYKNGNKSNLDFYSGFSFIAPNDLKYIYFKIDGTDLYGEKRNFSVGLPYEFIDQQTYLEKQKDFIFYILALLTAAIFSVPALIVNLKTILGIK